MRSCISVVALLLFAGVVCAAEPCGDVACVPAVEVKTKTHTCYSLRTKVVCLPYKPGGDCACGECGRPRQVRLLIKKFIKEEHPERVCQPAEPCPKP